MIHDGSDSMDVLRRAFTLLKKAWNRFSDFDIEAAGRDRATSASRHLLPAEVQYMSVYGTGTGFALPYPTGQADRMALAAAISEETDRKLRGRLERLGGVPEAKVTETRDGTFRTSNICAILVAGMLVLVLARFFLIVLIGY